MTGSDAMAVVVEPAPRAQAITLRSRVRNAATTAVREDMRCGLPSCSGNSPIGGPKGSDYGFSTVAFGRMTTH